MMADKQHPTRILNPAPDCSNESASERPGGLVSVIVLNWNGTNFLSRCLDALSAQTYRDFELIVLDNASTDQSTQGIESRYPGLRLVSFERNLGFAIANNRGAAMAKGEWLAFLNNDAFPEPDWLAELIRAASENPDYSFFSSCIVQAANPDVVQSSGVVCHISGFAWSRDQRQPISRSQRTEDEVFSPCAAAAFYRRDVFLSVDGFNEAFVSHLEDVDLGFRLRLKGQRCLYAPRAIVAHIGSASYGIENEHTVYQVQRNVIWSYFANMPGILFWLYLPIHLITNLVILLHYSARGQFRPVWKAKRDAIKALPCILKKRKSLQQSRTASPAEIKRILNHHWLGPFILGKRFRQFRSMFEAK